MSRLANVGLLLLSLVLAAVLLEGGLRLYAQTRSESFVGSPRAHDELVYDPLLEYWLRPGFRSADGHTTHDSYGFRQNGSPRTEMPSRPVVLLGGSTVYGVGVQRDDQTIAAYLERELRDNGRAEAAVLNAGVHGFTSLQSLLVYHAKVASLRPSVVVLLAGFNDIFYALDEQWESKIYEIWLRARRDPALDPVARLITDLEFYNCFSCYYLGSQLQSLAKRTGFSPARQLARVLWRRPDGEANLDAMRLQAAAIQELARRVEHDNSCLVVAWQPLLFTDPKPLTPAELDSRREVASSSPEWDKLASPMYESLRAFTRDAVGGSSPQVFDLTTVFAGLTERAYVDDGTHYTVLANRLLAQALAPTVADCARTFP